ncbi:MAG: hypothetical protein WBV52_11100, partial [Pseudolabrys sp.]
MAPHCYRCAGQCPAKAPITGVLGHFKGGFEGLELSQLHGTLVARPGHCAAEQPERDFGRQFVKTARLKRNRPGRQIRRQLGHG